MDAEFAAELRRWDDAGLRRELAAPEGVDFASNDYLGLAQDPRVIRGAVEAAVNEGAGAPGARLLRGQRAVHDELESAMAAFAGTEAALLFPSGWQANQAAMRVLLGAQDVVFSDALNHASLIDAMRASGATREVFPHADLDALRSALARHPNARRRLVVVEDVYSMDGDRFPVKELLALCEEFDAVVHLDRAHGAGLVDDPVPGHPRVVSRLITGGKALGVSGGVLCGSATYRELLIHAGRSWMFTTAVAPPVAGALIASLRVIAAEPERGIHAQKMADRLRSQLRRLGIESGGETAIVPVVLGEAVRAMSIAESVREAGFDVRAVRPPTVPEGSSRLRIVCHASHSSEIIDALAECLAAAINGRPSARPEAAPISERAPQHLVIAGTDTGVGKTVVTALLARAYERNGIRVRAWKPIQTGSDSDTDTVRRLAELDASRMPAPAVSLALPASVDQAADAEGAEVRVDAMVQRTRAHLASEATPCLLECAGGLRVPWNSDEDQLDYLGELGLPVVLVARSGLGTLNHTLLSVDALHARGLRLHALFLVGEPHPQNERSLRARLGAAPIVTLPYFATIDALSLTAWLDETDLEWVPKIEAAGSLR